MLYLLNIVLYWVSKKSNFETTGEIERAKLCAKKVLIVFMSVKGNGTTIY